MMRQSRRLAGKIRGLFIRLLILSAQGLPEDREAMWSVPRPFKHAYFALLVALGSPPLVVIIVESAATIGDQSWWMNVIQTIILSATQFAPVGLGAAIALLIVVHIGAILMSLYHAIANRWVKPVIEDHEARGRTEGRAEGRTAERAEWREWLNRKDEAEARGLPFDEPPPDEERPASPKRRPAIMPPNPLRLARYGNGRFNDAIGRQSRPHQRRGQRC